MYIVNINRFFIIILTLTALAVTGCSRLDRLTWDMTPDQWLASHAHIVVTTSGGPFVLAEPSSSIIVFALGLFLGVLGVMVLRDRMKSRSRLLWGAALVFWSLSTFFAGVSYQLFSYMLKCAGRTVCLWTTWWEIAYYFFFVISMNLIVIAVAQSSLAGWARKALSIYAVLNTSVYSVALFAGALIPNKLLCSFEFMVLFIGPSFLALMIINMVRFRRSGHQLDIRLFWAWAGLFLSTALYFAYYVSGFAETLWTKGIWFNANDVLHLGLIGWCLYFLFGVKPLIQDREQEQL